MVKKIGIILIIIIAVAGIGYYLYTRISVRLFIAGKIIQRKTFEDEKILGAKIHFTKIKKGWIRSPLKGEMDDIWKKSIGRRGMNYFFVGAPKTIFRQFSERFNPQSKFYEAWFGCYTILDGEEGTTYGFIDGNPDLKKLSELALEDQNAWLRAYRVENPYTKLDKMLGKLEVLNIEGHQAYLSFFEGETLSDLNEKGSTSQDLNKILGVPDKKIWEKIVKSHHQLTLKGFSLVWREPSYAATFCCYGCGPEFETLDGRKIAAFDRIKDDLLEMAKGIKIKAIK